MNDTHAAPAQLQHPAEYDGPLFNEHDRMYLIIAAVLAVLTLAEVILSYTRLEKASLAVPLLLLAAIKFAIVTGFFMHLRFDKPVFRRLFVIGGILAGFCYIGVLSAMNVLDTPTLILPIHWIVYIAASVAAIFIWVVRDDRGGDLDADSSHVPHHHEAH